MPQTIAEYVTDGAYGYTYTERLYRNDAGQLRIEVSGFTWRGQSGGFGRSLYAIPESLGDILERAIRDNADTSREYCRQPVSEIIAECSDVRTLRREGYARPQ